MEVELELPDPILGRAAVVVPRDEIGGAAAAIGDHEADVKTRRRDVDLDENPPRMRPRLRAMPKACAEVNGLPAALVAGLRPGDQRRHPRLEDATRADAEHVGDPFGFQLGFDGRRRHPGVRAQEYRRVRKPPAQQRQDVPELVDHPGRTRIPPGTQPCPQQESGATFEPDERVIHVLVVPAMNERELLGPVRRIIRAVKIEDEIGRVLVGAVGVGTEPVDADASEALNRGPVDRMLQPRERWLRPQGRASIASGPRTPRTYHVFFEGDGIFAYSFVNYPG